MEVLDTIRELQTLPENIHLLCPRKERDDYGRYDGPEEKDVFQQAMERRDKALSCLPILAFSQDGLEELQDWVWRKFDDTLENCDFCIRMYHQGKLFLADRLKENYDDEDIEKLMRLMEDWDIKRMKKNLKAALDELKAVPPDRIGLDALKTASLLAIFECLSSEAMQRDVDTLKEYFNEPFRLIQTKRTLKLTDYVPGLTNFLFDPDPIRNHWALHGWSRFRRPPTSAEFDWAVKNGLTRALFACSPQQVPPPDVAMIQRLWIGLRTITLRLDKDQITHNLRALDMDPCRLSVEHLVIPSPGLRYLLNTIQILLEKAPGDFWDAMQTISPQMIAEQVFNNPQFDTFLLQATETELFAKSPLRDMLSWINPFMSSLKGINQTPACRYIVSQLFRRSKDQRFPMISRFQCFLIGTEVLMCTLCTFTNNESSRGSVARVVLSETLEIVNEHIHTVVSPESFGSPERDRAIINGCMDVVRNTLALECQSLKTDYEVLLHHSTLHHGVSTYSPGIWDAVINKLSGENHDLSTAALRGILDLVGLEKFPTRGEDSKEKTHYNVVYGHLTHLSCQIIERLADFNPEHLDLLFASQDTNCALISALFSADLNTYQAAVDLIKNVSSQSARRDAISHLLQSFFSTAVYGFGWSFFRISALKTFGSAPRMLHTGTDIIDVLCDTQTGILRTRKLANSKECTEIQTLWQRQWSALTTIFDMTEAWHNRGNDKQVMLEFCRDTIQFADLLFAQYGVLASAMAGVDGSKEDSVREALLQFPTDTMKGMVKWLRLKDEYLATTLVGLVSKILRRLGELNITSVDKNALQMVENVAITGSVKTILTAREKAELVRALEAYYKKPVVTASTASLKKQISITAFARQADSSGTSTPNRATSEEDYEDGTVPDEMLMQLSRSVELNKARIAAQPQKKLVSSTTRSPLVIPKLPGRPPVMVETFREKREREKEAKKKRDQAELARLKKHLPAPGVAEQTAGQGSGVQGGVRGKDHTPVDSMMVDSESESEDDSDDEVDAELFGKKSASTPAAVREYEESRKKSLKQQGPVKKTRQLRSARDMRARLSPDLSSLHHTLLGWDFFASGDLPTNSDRTDYSLVSSSFRDPIEYQRTFEPLLVLEAWQGFQSDKEEANFKPFEITVATRLSVDSFMEVSTVLKSAADLKDFGLGEADIVLLSKSRDPVNDRSAPHCLARISSISRKKGTVEVSYRVNPGSTIVPSLAPGVSLWAARITSMTPLEREYGALMALQYYDLCEEIIKAKPSPLLKYSDATLEPIVDNYSVNLAQAKAIKSALDNDAFTLIQGPPGSGKTKTIVALVGALLSNSLGNRGVSITRPNESKPSNQPSRTTAAKKLLVCAPSNAAVDELVMRFKAGVKTLQGRSENLSVVRLGRSDAINANVLDVTLDELVNARLNQSMQQSSGERDMQKIYEEHKTTDTQFKEIRAKLDQYRAKGQNPPEDLTHEFEVLKKKRTQLSQNIDNARDHNNAIARNNDLTRRRIQQEIIDSAHVICATLSGSGHDMFQHLSIDFETVIIDEAAQSIELSALIPLKYGCAKCILVGDPKQLPPTVLSKEASRFQYEQSLFVRMQSNHPNDVHLLDVQYRMHPEISRFPSLTFYEGLLQDGPNMAALRTRPWHNSTLLSPYRFFDVQGLHSNTAKGHSLINIAELNVAMRLYERLVTDFKSYDFSRKIGIITPYKGQLREMKSRFAAKYGNSILATVEFNTTDAFQGRESEVIIFSCVRASNKGIGFLSDIRRMNVGLTRAKSSLWVLGNSQSLAKGEYWNKLITDARKRNIYTDGDVLSMLQRPQFTGYRNVEMTDVDQDESHSSAVQTPTETTRSSNEMESVSARNTPGPVITGPSGGHNGLDETKACGYCGSTDHFTRNCDNVDALESAAGICFRCKEPGHTKMKCSAPRCLMCGAVGHEPERCESTKVLSQKEKNKIANEEHRHKHAQQAKREEIRQKIMKSHDPKVPVVKVSTKSPPTSPKPQPAVVKRKLPPSGPFAKNTKRKTDVETPQEVPSNLVKPSRDGPSYNSLSQASKTGMASRVPPPESNKGPQPPRGPMGGRPGPRPSNQARKKKEADPFIRPKRR
ncbi:putative tRNA-splicing endonuclease [Talaromyces proteolyticus]|uniref:tRNA-splicing endonuclease n=1 Tax=Talaromyces proteolyticus TaxID=1131652 RepID=A0AAD4PUF1_9EURO|nr:putative tRNA-splicing endonuclease [Talaromyces proteolyticus]KAH8695036.1 putative tRNA-splicing endonuclease [Talaromyces proteolyticus]